MIRRDYIVDAIEEFAGVIAKLLGCAKEADWSGASSVAAGEFQKLTGLEAAQTLALSPTQLFARLVENAPTQLAEIRLYMLATLLKSQGELLAGQGRAEEGRAYTLKGLHLLLEASDQTTLGKRPDFVPAIETFLANLGAEPLSVETQVLLMRHYEKMGDFGQAENALFAILDTGPPAGELLEFGEAFYQRLAQKSDEALLAGNLPRAETQAGLKEFRAKLGK